jgi:K+/H+ antiporter YhaU regulatory subunit KhtT
MLPEYVTLIGIIVQTVFWLAGGYAMVIRNDGSNKSIKDEIKGIQEELKSLAEVVTTMAVQEERMNNLSSRMNMIDKRMDDLVRKSGWVEGRRIVDGEYP